MKKQNAIKSVNATDLAKALTIKTDVRAGLLSPVTCRACGLGGAPGIKGA